MGFDTETCNILAQAMLDHKMAFQFSPPPPPLEFEKLGLPLPVVYALHFPSGSPFGFFMACWMPPLLLGVALLADAVACSPT